MPPSLPLISVIVPIYGVETYLRHCINSIIGQTYKKLEIILVDDGSPDECGAICDEYSAMDSRIRVIHKFHGGISSARNAGISVANGKLIGFVDADDYLHPQMYEKLFEAMKRESAEMAICGFKYVDDRGKPISNTTSDKVKSQIMTGYEAASFLCNRLRTPWVMMINKLYQASLFYNLSFPDGRIHEDEYIVHRLFDRCKRIVSIADSLYYYIQRPGSIMHEDKMRTINECYAVWDRYLFYQEKGSGYEVYATRALQICSDLLEISLWKLDWNEYKTILKPQYKKMLYLFIGRFDPRAGSLFIRRHRWLRRLWQKLYRTSQKAQQFVRRPVFLLNHLFAKNQ